MRLNAGSVGLTENDQRKMRCYDSTMPEPAPLFGLTLTNVPIVNLRNDFRYHLGLLADDAFRSRLGEKHDAVYTDYTAYATREAFLTHVLQRSVMGLESYLPWAVIHEAGLRQRLSREIFNKARDPFSLGGRSTVANYYDRLPSLLDPSCSLRAFDESLYQTTGRFYREIRNALFHGHEIHGDDRGDGTLEALRFIARLYEWIDSWCPPEDMWKKRRGAATEAPATDTKAKKGQVTLKLRIPTLRKP